MAAAVAVLALSASAASAATATLDTTVAATASPAPIQTGMPPAVSPDPTGTPAATEAPTPVTAIDTPATDTSGTTAVDPASPPDPPATVSPPAIPPPAPDAPAVVPGDIVTVVSPQIIAIPAAGPDDPTGTLASAPVTSGGTITVAPVVAAPPVAPVDAAEKTPSVVGTGNGPDTAAVATSATPPATTPPPARPTAGRDSAATLLPVPSATFGGTDLQKTVNNTATPQVSPAINPSQPRQQVTEATTEVFGTGIRSGGVSADSGSGSFLQFLAAYVVPGAAQNPMSALLLMFPLAFLLAAFTPRIPKLHLVGIIAERGSGCRGFNPVALRPG